MTSTLQPLTLEDILKRNIKIPVCPAVFLSLVEALNNPKQQNDKLVDMLSSDASLTAQILKAANSAFYSSVRTVRSVDDAIVRLGYTEIWSIASACKGKEMFKASTPEMEHFFAEQWDHSLKTGIFARTLARRLNPRFADLFFTAGILHDIGKLLLAQAGKDYLELSAAGKCFGDELVKREIQQYSTQHATLGAELLKFWKIPDLVVKPIAAHHDKPTDGSAKDSWRILAVADHVAHSVESTAIDNRRTFKVSIPDHLAASIGMTKEDFLAITSETLKQVAVLRSL